MSSSASINLVVKIVFLALFVDNLVTTIIIPILPMTIKDELELGILFSAKALVQIIFNPIAGILIGKVGSVKLLQLGNIVLLLGNLLFCATRSNFYVLLVSRCLQGVSSALIGTSGLSLLAEVTIPNGVEEVESDQDESAPLIDKDVVNDDKDVRGSAMGNAMAGLALGVMVGPPLGGILYKLGGNDKWLAFSIVSLITLVQSGMLIHHSSKLPKATATETFSSTSTSSIARVEKEQRKRLDSFYSDELETEHLSLSNLPSTMDKEIQEEDDDDDCSTLADSQVQHSISYTELLRHPTFFLLFAALFMTNVSLSFTEPTLPILWKDQDFTNDAMVIGALFTIQTLAYSLSSPFAGRFPGWRLHFVAFGLLCMAISLPLLTVVSWFPAIDDGNSKVVQACKWTLTVLGLIGTGLAVGLVDGSSMPVLAELLDTHAANNSTNSITSDCPSTPSSNKTKLTSASTSSSSADLNAYGKLFALSEISINLGFLIGPLFGTGLMSAVSFSFADLIMTSLNALLLPVFWILIMKRPMIKEMLNSQTQSNVSSV